MPKIQLGGLDRPITNLDAQTDGLDSKADSLNN